MLILKQVRNAKGLSQAKLSKNANVPLRTIQDAEARGDCRVSTAHKLAVALGVSMDELWKDETE